MPPGWRQSRGSSRCRRHASADAASGRPDPRCVGTSSALAGCCRPSVRTDSVPEPGSYAPSSLDLRCSEPDAAAS
eukprot:11670993-Heterocapsa_arctica.AAC.1